MYGTSAITAITAQNTVGLHASHAVPLQDVRAQIDAVVADLRPQALKTGMLANAELVCGVADAIEAHALGRYVMDPVMVATGGARLLDSGAEASLLTRLLPLATLITPNLHEAAILVGEPVETVGHMSAAARRLVELGAGAALIKGGHLDGDAVDVLWDGDEGERMAAAPYPDGSHARYGMHALGRHRRRARARRVGARRCCTRHPLRRACDRVGSGAG